MSVTVSECVFSMCLAVCLLYFFIIRISVCVYVCNLCVLARLSMTVFEGSFPLVWCGLVLFCLLRYVLLCGGVLCCISW